LIALCEEASCRAIAQTLAEGTTTVGMKVGLDHLQPSAIGERVVAEAVLLKVEGRRLTFTVSASDDRGLVAVGKVVRVIVDRDRFMGKCGA
jgi:predicted thioesterase